MAKSSSTSDKTTYKSAVTAGLALIGMAILAPVAHFGILPNPVTEDPLTTIINKQHVYKVGSSIKDLGNTQSSISKINDDNVSKRYIRQFENWWNEASRYTAKK